MKTVVTALITMSVLQAIVHADEALQKEIQQDVVLRALVDELERGKVGLKLEDLERPYFIEYGLSDQARAHVTASLGAVTGKNVHRSRRLRSEMRVGSYELDNTNFRDRSGGYWGRGMGMFGGSAIPIEDDYNAIRQAVWWATDRKYKDVVETLAKKKAFMETKVIEDKPNDFSRETPTVYFEDRVGTSIDVVQLEGIALSLSRIFREYPDVKKSTVRIAGEGGNGYLVNTEGTRLRTSGMRYSVSINATAQSDDGMEFSDSIEFHARKFEQLPDLGDLSKRCRETIEQLIALKTAPKLESYTGPVLFEPRAAAEIFWRHFSRRFSGGQRSVGSRTSPDDFANKIGKRILPRFVNVVDDPARETISGVTAMGHYKYDQQGVAARPVNLVESGRLKALVMSRNPSKEFDKSTGHGRGSYRVSATTGCLILTAEPGTDQAGLKKELLEACEDEDLEFGLRVASLAGPDRSSRSFSSGFDMDFDFDMFGGRRRGSGTTPLATYKVYPDGREELVRGAEFARIDLKAFKRMLAVGDTPHVYNTHGPAGRTVAVPALLFEELDLAKIDRDFDQPPILPTPLARAGVE